MNAHAHHTLTSLAVDHNLLLRRIGETGRPIESAGGLATELGYSDKDNFRKLLIRLEADDLVVRKDGPHPCGLGLTTRGERARDLLTLGDDGLPGQAEPVPAATPTWPHHLLRLSPENPRKLFDSEQIAGLAMTIQDEGVLFPLIVSPPDGEGFRTILDGARRWLATEWLIRCEERLLPPDHPLPIQERELTPGEVAFMALVTQHREPLTPLEDARALEALARERGWSARQVARQIGRASEASERGVRDVQEKIKVVREAPAEAIAEHEAGRLSWEDLRETVRVAKVIENTADPLVWNGRRYPNITILREAQRIAAGEGGASSPAKPRTSGSAADADQSDPRQSDIEDFAPPNLSDRERLALIELAWACEHRPYSTGPDGRGRAQLGEFWLHPEPGALQGHRLILMISAKGEPWSAALTDAGERWLRHYGIEGAVTVPDLTANRYAVTKDLNEVEARAPTDYVTPWLHPLPLDPGAATAENDAAASPIGAAPPDAAEPEEFANPRLPGVAHVDGDNEPDPDAESLLEGALALGLKRRHSKIALIDPASLGDLLAEAGFKAPFRAAGTQSGDPTAGCVVDTQGNVLVVADVNGDHPDAFARAIAELVALCVNDAAGAIERAEG